MPERTQIINGETYYSPNSARTVEIFGGDVLNPFQRDEDKGRLPQFWDLLHPLPWTIAFGWLAFVQIRPSIGIYPLSRLQTVPPPVVDWIYEKPIPPYWPDGLEWPYDKIYSYRMPCSGRDLWLTIGNTLYGVVIALKTRYNVAMVLPFLPWGHGFYKRFSRERNYRSSAKSSRDWMFIWLGAVSYLIAESEVRRGHNHKLPFWEDVVSPLVQPSLLDALRCTLANFSHHHSRVGCVIDLINPPPSQPPVSFFKHFNIPVWYKPPPVTIPLGPTPFITPPLHCDLGKNTWLLPPGPPHSESVGCSTLHSPALLSLLPSIPTPPPQTVFRNSILEPHLVHPPEKDSSPRTSPPPSPYNVPFNAPLERRPTNAHLHDTFPLIPPPSPAPSIPPIEIRPQNTPAKDFSAHDQWDDHESHHRQRHEELLRNETPTERQRRESRTRTPPVNKVVFNEWTKTEDNTWTRTRLLGADARARPDTFKGEQKFYDAFCNEWNLSYDWMPNSNAELESDSDDDYDGLPCGPFTLPEDAAAPATKPLDFYQPMPSHSYDTETEETLQLVDDELDAFGDDNDMHTSSETQHNYLAFKNDIPAILGYFYGFVMPLPDATPPKLDDVTDATQVTFIRIMGHSPSPSMFEAIPSSFFSSSEYLWAQSFFDALSSKISPPPATHDLQDDVILPVRQTVRFQQIKTTPYQETIGEDTFQRTLYHFSLSEKKNGRRLCVANAAIALMICRLPDIWDKDRILDFLVRKAVSFKLFTPKPYLTKIPYYKAHNIDRLPERGLNHVFTKADYDAYVYNRSLILAQPHMQAIIRRGGMVWRLALATLGASDALRPPTGAAMTVSATFADDPQEYIEDDISALELDLICGAYVCRDKPGGQKTIKSWWPLQRFFEKPECGENYGFWSHRREEWYITRLKNIQDPQGGEFPQRQDPLVAEGSFKKGKLKQPMSYSQWKTALRGTNSIRRVIANVAKQSSEYTRANT